MAYEPETTLGDGNCLYNAFILAYARALEQIRQQYANDAMDVDQELREFIQRASTALKVTNQANAVFDKIKTLVEQNPEQLQRSLGPVMRDISIDRMRHERDRYLKNTEDALIAAFYRPAEDDIFFVHPHIRRKFAEFAADSSNSAIPDQLRKWWNNSGFDDYLKNMADNKAKYWGGAEDLVALSDYFRVSCNVQFRTANRFVSLNSAHGSLPSEAISHSKETAKELSHRNVISAAIKSNAALPAALPFTSITKETLTRRLGTASRDENEQKNIVEYLRNNQGQLKNRPVPATWRDETQQELQQRGILSKTKTGNQLKFTDNFAERPQSSNDYSLSDALTRVDALPEEASKKVIAAYDARYKKRVALHFENQRQHWSNLRKVERKANHAVSTAAPVKSATAFFVPEKEKLKNVWDTATKVLAQTAKNEDQTYSLDAYLRANGALSDALTSSHVKAINDINKEARIKYTLQHNTSIWVDRKTQTQLDHEYAKQLQLEEIEANKSPKLS